MKSNHVNLIILACIAMTVALCASVPERAAHWPECFTSGNLFDAHAIVEMDAAAMEFFEVGDIVGVFDSDGDCVGFTAVTSLAPFALRIKGDDPVTPEKDGAIGGSALSFRLFGERELAVQSDSTLSYVHDGLYRVNSVYMGTDKGSELDSLQAIVVALEQEVDFQTQAREAAVSALEDLEALHFDAVAENQTLNDSLASVQGRLDFAEERIRRALNQLNRTQ